MPTKSKCNIGFKILYAETALMNVNGPTGTHYGNLGGHWDSQESETNQDPLEFYL